MFILWVVWIPQVLSWPQADRFNSVYFYWIIYRRFIIDESKLQPRFEYILKNKFLIKEIVTEDSLKKIKDKVILLENNINNEISELTNKDQWWSLDDRHKELTKNYWWFDEIAEGSLRLIVRNYIEECLLKRERRIRKEVRVGRNKKK